MKIKRKLKNVMKEITKRIERHRRLQKEAFCGKKRKLAKSRALLEASRKKLHALLDREEALENHFLHPRHRPSP